MTKRKGKEQQGQRQLLQEPEKDRIEGVAKLITERIFNQPMPEKWIDQIEDHVEKLMKPVMLRLAQEAALEALQSSSTFRTQPVGEGEEPPEPTRVSGTRRENRDWGRISATVDKNLLKHFNLERKQRRLSASRLLETILWLHYGKPELSYGEKLDAETENKSRL